MNKPMPAKEMYYLTKGELHGYKREVFMWQETELRWSEVDRIQERIKELKAAE